MALNPNMKLIEAKTVGAGGVANIEFTSIPSTYTDLILKISARTSSDTTYAIRFNNNTSNYSGASLRGYGAGTPISYQTSAYSFSTTAVGLGYVNDVASTFTNCEVYIPNYASNNNKSFIADNVQEENVSDPVYANLTTGLWSDTTAITSIKIIPETGTISQYSTFYLYGVTSASVGAKATGGIITQDATYFYHTFKSSGTFTPTISINVDMLIIAGGGSAAAANYSGGGGAGGLRSASSQSLTASNYTVEVGAGGASQGTAGARGNNGTNSSISGSGITTLTSTGGGGGGGDTVGGNSVGASGGSGGGNYTNATGAGGAGNAGSYTPSEGNSGGGGATGNGGGGGGGGGAGEAGNTDGYTYGGDGSSAFSSWGIATQTGENVAGTVYYAGGGGGGPGSSQGYGQSAPAPGGNGGGGQGSSYLVDIATAGTANTGGGGGGIGGIGGAGKAGGSGLVIIRYAK